MFDLALLDYSCIFKNFSAFFYYFIKAAVTGCVQRLLSFHLILTRASFIFKTWFHFVFVFLKLRDCELAPGVNRDLIRRVRNVNGIAQHKQVLRNDIKLSAKLIHALDEKGSLWSSRTQEEGQGSEVLLINTFPICLRFFSDSF